MDKFNLLQQLGAGEFQHLNGSLEAHLKGTSAILESWHTSEILQTAGLFHAAYGTTAFDKKMVSLSQRNRIAEIIGEEAEALVYLYCSCDRNYVFSQLDQSSQIKFKDRFNNNEFLLSSEQATSFCLLTVANELELVTESSEFKANHGSALLSLFKKMERYLVPKATLAYKKALAEFI